MAVGVVPTATGTGGFVGLIVRAPGFLFGSGGSPRAPSASPSGTWVTNVGGGGGTDGSGTSQPDIPVAMPARDLEKE